MYWRELFPFQKEVVDKMIKKNHFIDGDDTGLGKTDVAIFVCEHWLYFKRTRVVIVCLNETKEQWIARIKRTTYKKNKIFTTGYGNKAKQKTREYRLSLYDSVNNYEYIVLTYNNLTDDLEYILKIENPCVVVFDECRKLKNRNSKIHKNGFTMVQEFIKQNKDLKIYGLDATLLPNEAVEEVFWICEILIPYLFGTGNYNWYKFCNEYIKFNFYGGVEHYKNLDSLYFKFKEYFIKRHHSHPAIAPYIPKKIEKVYYCELGNKKLYETIGSDLLFHLDNLALLVNSQYNDKLNESRYKQVLLKIKKEEGAVRSLYNTLTQLCFHSGLLLKSDTLINKNIIQEHKIERNLKEKGKALFICDRVEGLIKENKLNKILVMTFFIEGLEILKDILREKGIRSLIYRGGKEKDVVINEFKTNKNIRVLLLQSSIGGCSLDIPQANHIFRDIMETPADMKQQNRITRLGSSFDTNILHDVVCRGTIEEKMYKDNFRKEAVSQLITEGKQISDNFMNADGTVKAKINSLREFLRNTLTIKKRGKLK